MIDAKASAGRGRLDPVDGGCTGATPPRAGPTPPGQRPVEQHLPKPCRRQDGEPKLRYDPLIARDAAAWLRTTTDEPYDAYACVCGAWHIGRLSQTVVAVTRAEPWEAELGTRAAEMLARENSGRRDPRRRAIRSRFRRAHRRRRGLA